MKIPHHFFEQLGAICSDIARGDHDRARELFELSTEGRYPPEISALAEAFGMMMVQVEAREYRLEGTIDDLTRAREELTVTNRQLVQTLEELKQTQLQLIQKAKLESVGRLAAGVAHEVKNPLAILQMGIDFLEISGPTEPAQQEVVREMAEAVQRADQVIKALLDFSRSDTLDARPAPLAKTVEDSLLLVRHELVKGRIEARTDLDPALPLLVLDTNKMKQVFINLFMNATHAMPDGGSISITAIERQPTPEELILAPAGLFAPGETAVVMKVADTGTGIATEQADKLFDPFFTTKPVGIGTGLGLSITRKILELHRAAIGIGNRKDARGAEVTILFKITRKAVS